MPYLVKDSIPAEAGMLEKIMPQSWRNKTSIYFRFTRDKLNLLALILLAVITLISFSAGWISQYILRQDRDALDLNLFDQGFHPPTAPGIGGHLLGTDESARDFATRLLFSGQVSLSVGFLAAGITITIGTTLGLLGGYFGGWLDDLLNALIQIISNLPTIFLLIIFSFFFFFNVFSLSLVIGSLSWMSSTRVIRGEVLTLRNKEYIAAAKLAGASDLRIIVVHLLPNLTPLILIGTGFDMVNAMLTEAGLSYLGFGVSIPIPSWGNLLTGSFKYFENAPWLVYPPAIALAVTIFCVYVVTNGLRDALDSKQD